MAEITTASGLIYEDTVVGAGAEAKAGDHVVVHYTGWLTNGSKFDSSKDRNDPFQFPLGQRHVIAGAKVTVSVVSHGRGDKIRIFKMRRRKHYQKHQGHRQNYTEIRVDAISK